ncbi:MAG: ABC transporter substrate-binding protein [Actinomycetota bacterium]|nr:ABC transporter substrate-binding protein [Actinomycetota bacterium]
MLYRNRKTPALTTLALVAALLVALALPLGGCSSSDGASGEPAEETATTTTATFPVTVTDDAGREVTIKAAPERIVSLAPANTEIVAALGMIDELVGVTTFDDYPPEVVDLPKMGDFVTPNMEAIAAAEPDIILATTGVQADVITKLEQTGAVVVAVDPQNLEQLYSSIGMLGKVLGEPDKAAKIVDDMRAGIDYITTIVSAEESATCFIEIAQDPLFTAGKGTLLDDLIAVAGGVNVVTQDGYIGYSLEQLVTDNPQVYLATKGSMSDPADLAKRPGYDKLAAVAGERVAVLDDNLISRPGPRVVEGVGELAVALHPGLFTKK